MRSDRVSRHVGAWVVAVSLGTLTATAFAQSEQDRTTARILAEEADERLSKQDFAGALDRLVRANTLFPAPTLMLAIGRARIKLGQLLEAQAAFREAAMSASKAGEPAKWAEARKAAADEAEKIVGRVAALTITLTGVAPGVVVEVTVDGEIVSKESIGAPRAFNPGKRVVRAKAEGYRAAESAVTLTEGGRQSLELHLERAAVAAPSAVVSAAPIASTTPSSAPPPVASAPAPPPAPQRSSLLPILGFSAGGAFLIAGSVFGLITRAKVNDIKGDCAGNACPPNRKSDADSASTFATISDITFVLGALGVGVGVYGLLAPPSDSSSSAIQLLVGPRSLGLDGKF